MSHEQSYARWVKLSPVLCKQYGEWVVAQGLPELSADDQDTSTWTDKQKTWLADFIQRWEAMERACREPNDEDAAPVLLSYDMAGAVFEGFASGRLWNGFDEITVTREQLQVVLGDHPAEAEETAEWEASFARGERALLSGWTTSIVDPDNHALAQKFTEKLRAVLTPEQFEQMRERNSSNTDPNVCASHDFCDANEYMAEAFEEQFGREPDFSDKTDADITRMNDAWDLARALNLIEGA